MKRAALLSERGNLSLGPAGATEPIKPGDIYVLTATNKEALQVSQALREAGVPFAFYKQEGLFQTDEARAIHDLLAAVADPGDPDKRGRAWITPFFAVPLAALSDLDDLADSDPLIKWLRDWNELARDRRFEMLFTRILDDSGIIRRELFLKEDERALTNYLHIFEILLEETRTVGRDLADLVAVLTSYIQQTSKPSGEDGNIQRLESDRAAVQIMTIHKSKGLEAAVVFLYGGYGRYRGGAIHEYHEDDERVLYIGDDDLARARASEERTQEEQRLYYVALTRAKARLYLPLVPEQLSNRKWDGGYRRLNDRLYAITSHCNTDERNPLFKVISFHDRPVEAAEDPLSPAPGDPAAWRPDGSLLKVHDHTRECRKYRQMHAGYVISSYSRMKRAWSGELNPLERDEFRRDPGTAALANLLSEHDLPGGTATGTMLHEVLEKIPFDSLRTSSGFEDWIECKTVKDVFNRALARNGITPTARQRRQAELLIHRALTITLRLDADRSIPGLYQCQNVISELEFLFPFPEDNPPVPSESKPGKLVIEKGFIKGFVDLVVEHEGRVYFADWKSDILLSYETDSITKHVDLHYDTQVKLYSLALVKALRIENEFDYEKTIGGLFYVFLRA